MTSLTTLCAASLLLSSAVATPPAANEYQTLMDNVSPALVTIKFVLKFQGPGGTRDFEREITATMIDKNGLVLCSGVQLGTSRLFRRMGTATPTDIKILIGDDTVGIDAKLVATDAELDLAWVKAKDSAKVPAGAKFVDFATPNTAALGDRVLSVSRMDKFFDRAPIVAEGRVAGSTKKPRDLLVPSGGLELEPGMPVFNASGLPIGVAVFQSPAPDEVEEGTRGPNATLILPTEQLNKATQRALATAAEESEEEDDGLTAAKTDEKDATKADE